MIRSTRVRTRLRRRSRGAALVEALVVIPTLVVLTLGLLYVSSAHAKRNRVLREAEAKVWPKSLKGCRPGGGDTSLGRVDGKLSEAKQLATGPSLRDPLETGIETIEDSAEQRSMNANQDDMNGVTVRAEAKVSCNEQSRSISRGDVDQVARSFFRRYM